MLREKLIEHRVALAVLRRSLDAAQGKDTSTAMATATAVVAAEKLAEIVAGMVEDAITFQELLERQTAHMKAPPAMLTDEGLLSGKPAMVLDTRPARCEGLIKLPNNDVMQCALADGHAGECAPPAPPEVESMHSPTSGYPYRPATPLCGKCLGDAMCTRPEGHAGECVHMTTVQ